MAPELTMTPPGQVSELHDTSGAVWVPMYEKSCTFPPEIFREVMLNLIRNPNIDSNHLFRADISLDILFSDSYVPPSDNAPRITQFQKFNLNKILVRTLIPRNPHLDKPLDQTCLFYERSSESGLITSLVIYFPHISSPEESPFYHPTVHGIAFIHNYNPTSKEGTVAIQYSFFDTSPRTTKLERTALRLISSVHKHGQGLAAGYVKKVQHDVIIPQATVQNTYARLKAKYAKPMIDAWVEVTDPAKHVFEDLSIAAFLIELWAEMYQGKHFPGFVDIGCGNGLLVHILLEEGYPGWGFDARARKSWSIYSTKSQENLHELVLIPSIIASTNLSESSTTIKGTINPQNQNLHNDARSDHTNNDQKDSKVHNGLFPSGTFIISNHADELTPWTPILANLSSSPFIMIPCCSHALTGARFRAPPPKDAKVSSSAYSSLVVWVSRIAQECGWDVEVEMLRIPSTRNTALIGRKRLVGFVDNEVHKMKTLVEKYGGSEGWEENAMKLVKASTIRGH